MLTLDLSDNTVIACLGGSVVLLDPRPVFECSDNAYFHRAETMASGATDLKACLACFRAGRIGADGALEQPMRVGLAHAAPVYGKKVVEGPVYYADGSQEDWRIQIDPHTLRFTWVRQPEDLKHTMAFRLVLPRDTKTFTLWQTGSGQTVAAAPDADGTLLDAPLTSEIFCMAATPKNSFRLEVPIAGPLTVQTAAGAKPLGDEAVWALNGKDACGVPLWVLDWQVATPSVLKLEGGWGITAAARDYVGRIPFRCTDASLDFGAFYPKLLTASLPLYLDAGDGGTPRLRATLEQPGSRAPLRDIALAAEFWHLGDPRAAGIILRNVLSENLDRVVDKVSRGTADEEAALLLLMAGRYHHISDDIDFIGARLTRWRELADHLLSLRPDKEPLPIARIHWPGPTLRVAKDPYFTALAFAALRRMAALEHYVGAPQRSESLLSATESMRIAACAPFDEGGLLHPGSGTFINCLDYEDPTVITPVTRNGATTTNGDDPSPRSEFLLHQNVLPFYFGLITDRAQVERAYDWIDDQYTYASGRGGATTPPGAARGLWALLDVYVRLYHGISGVDRVLQLVLDHSLDYGIPMLSEPYAARRASGANFADVSPYLGIVLGIHYGLEYTREGWRLSAPRPIANYPLTRVTNLRHRRATYSIIWQGRGRVKRVVLDGRTHRSDLLADSEGEHEVSVFLG